MSRARAAFRAFLLPGQFLHEAAHAAVGGRWASEVTIQWHPDPHVSFRWDDALVWQVAVAHLAPTLIGLPIGLLLAGSIAAGMAPGLPMLAWLWIFASWLYFSMPSPDDLDPLVQMLRPA